MSNNYHNKIMIIISNYNMKINNNNYDLITSVMSIIDKNSDPYVPTPQNAIYPPHVFDLAPLPPLSAEQ